MREHALADLIRDKRTLQQKFPEWSFFGRGMWKVGSDSRGNITDRPCDGSDCSSYPISNAIDDISATLNSGRCGISKTCKNDAYKRTDDSARPPWKLFEPGNYPIDHIRDDGTTNDFMVKVLKVANDPLDKATDKPNDPINEGVKNPHDSVSETVPHVEDAIPDDTQILSDFSPLTREQIHKKSKKS